MAFGAVLGTGGFAWKLRLDANSSFTQMLAPFLLIYDCVGIAVIATTAAILAAQNAAAPPWLR